MNSRNPITQSLIAGEAGKPSGFYLPGLIGLRFVAAFVVFFGHLQGAILSAKITGFPIHTYTRIAGDGVTLFFVLSGFLITYLLLNEKASTGTVSIRNFYMRRMLRIWPLYFFFTALTFFVIPHIAFLVFPNLDMSLATDFWSRFLLYLFMSPQIAIIYFACPGVGGPLWSVGVEEYFYLVWPHIIKRVGKFLPLVLILIIYLPYKIRTLDYHYLAAFFSYFRIDAMAIGGLGAWLYRNRLTWINWIFSRWTQCLIYLFALDMLVSERTYGTGAYDTEIYSLVYLLIIMNIALNKKSFLKLENRFVKFMGEISYGFYVFQWLSLVIFINCVTHFTTVRDGLAINLFISFGCFALNTIIATLSYYFLEQRFLLLKKKFSAFKPA